MGWTRLCLSNVSYCKHSTTSKWTGCLQRYSYSLHTYILGTLIHYSLTSKVKNGKKKEFKDSTDLTRPKRPVSQSYSAALLSPTKQSTGKRNPNELKFCGNVLREITNKKHLALNYVFLMPVDAVAMGIPQYLQIIQHPMDLSTIKLRLERGDYNDCVDFERDVRLMFNNCYTFNRPEDDVYQLGKRLETLFDERWALKPSHSQPTTSRKSTDSVEDGTHIIHHFDM